MENIAECNAATSKVSAGSHTPVGGEEWKIGAPWPPS